MICAEWHDYSRRNEGRDFIPGFRVASNAVRGKDTFLDIESLLRDEPLTRAEHNTVSAMREYGLVRGWTMPIVDRRSGTMSTLLLGCSKSQDEFSATVREHEQWIRRSLLFFTEGLTVNELRSRKGQRALSQREADCLAWIAAGRSTKEIGDMLKIATSTVSEYLSSATKKMGAQNRTQAAARAALLGACLN